MAIISGKAGWYGDTEGETGPRVEYGTLRENVVQYRVPGTFNLSAKCVCVAPQGELPKKRKPTGWIYNQSTDG